VEEEKTVTEAVILTCSCKMDEIGLHGGAATLFFFVCVEEFISLVQQWVTPTCFLATTDQNIFSQVSGHRNLPTRDAAAAAGSRKG